AIELSGQLEASLVQQVERFSAYLEAGLFSETDLLNDRSVPIEVPWSMQEVDRHVASLSRRYVKEDLARERRLVEAEGCDTGGRTGETWADQSELALGHVDIDH